MAKDLADTHHCHPPTVAYGVASAWEMCPRCAATTGSLLAGRCRSWRRCFLRKRCLPTTRAAREWSPLSAGVGHEHARPGADGRHAWCPGTLLGGPLRRSPESQRSCGRRLDHVCLQAAAAVVRQGGPLDSGWVDDGPRRRGEGFGRIPRHRRRLAFRASRSSRWSSKTRRPGSVRCPPPAPRPGATRQPRPWPGLLGHAAGSPAPLAVPSRRLPQRLLHIRGRHRDRSELCRAPQSSGRRHSTDATRPPLLGGRGPVPPRLGGQTSLLDGCYPRHRALNAQWRGAEAASTPRRRRRRPRPTRPASSQTNRRGYWLVPCGQARGVARSTQTCGTPAPAAPTGRARVSPRLTRLWPMRWCASA